MARREPIEITLGERTFKIRALTIDQMQAIEGILDSHRGRKDVLPLATSVLRAVLERDHKDAAGEFGAIECEMPEIALAFQAVLVHGGFAPQDPTKGEAPPRPSTGAGSAAASPPASA